MLRSLTVRVALGVVLVPVVVSLLTPPGGVEHAQARPQYTKAFEEKHKETIKKVNCNICHEGKDKKLRNAFGKAFDGCLEGAKNCKDAEKINAALDKAAEAKSLIEGKTFGDLIKEGKPPASPN